MAPEEIDDSMAVKLQKVYQYIYDIEEKRVGRKADKVKRHFELNPLDFDEVTIDEKMMTRIQKR